MFHSVSFLDTLAEIASKTNPIDSNINNNINNNYQVYFLSLFFVFFVCF